MNSVSSRWPALSGSLVLAVAGMLAGVTPAFATYPSGPCVGDDDNGECDISASIVQVPASGVVTFSNATQTNNVKYQVKLTHYSVRDEAFSQIKFVADTSVVAASGAGIAKIVGWTAPTAVGAPTPTGSCLISPDTHIECTFNFAAPYFNAKGATIDFDVTVQSPTAGPSQATAASLNFNSTTRWTEANGQPEAESFVLATPTSLAIPDPKVVETFLPVAGTIKTGTAGGVATCVGGPTGNDPNKWVTIVKVPASAEVGVDLNRPVTEAVVPGAFGNYSRIAIPGQHFSVGTHWYDPDAASKLLVITLRRDNCTIDGRGPLADALRILTEKVYYKPDPTPTNPTPQYAQLYLCFVTSGPTPGQPCIASLKVYTRHNSPSPDYWGDHEWVIYANENGKYQN